MRRGERLTITNVSGRNSAETVCTVIPLKILVSVQTGRRYLAARRLDARRFASFRLVTSRKRRLCRERKGTRPAKRWPSRFSPDPGERPFRAAAGGNGFP